MTGGHRSTAASSDRCGYVSGGVIAPEGPIPRLQKCWSDVIPAEVGPQESRVEGAGISGDVPPADRRTMDSGREPREWGPRAHRAHGVTAGPRCTPQTPGPPLARRRRGIGCDAVLPGRAPEPPRPDRTPAIGGTVGCGTSAMRAPDVRCAAAGCSAPVAVLRAPVVGPVVDAGTDAATFLVTGASGLGLEDILEWRGSCSGGASEDGGPDDVGHCRATTELFGTVVDGIAADVPVAVTPSGGRLR